jgi:hypothetical protein
MNLASLEQHLGDIHPHNRLLIAGLTVTTSGLFDSLMLTAAGYDIKSESGYEEMKAEFERVIGRQYLRAIHLNDSKGAYKLF